MAHDPSLPDHHHIGKSGRVTPLQADGRVTASQIFCALNSLTSPSAAHPGRSAFAAFSRQGKLPLRHSSGDDLTASKERRVVKVSVDLLKAWTTAMCIPVAREYFNLFLNNVQPDFSLPLWEAIAAYHRDHAWLTRDQRAHAVDDIFSLYLLPDAPLRVAFPETLLASLQEHRSECSLTLFKAAYESLSERLATAYDSFVSHSFYKLTEDEVLRPLNEQVVDSMWRHHLKYMVQEWCGKGLAARREPDHAAIRFHVARLATATLRLPHTYTVSRWCLDPTLVTLYEVPPPVGAQQYQLEQFTTGKASGSPSLQRQTPRSSGTDGGGGGSSAAGTKKTPRNSTDVSASRSLSPPPVAKAMESWEPVAEATRARHELHVDEVAGPRRKASLGSTEAQVNRELGLPAPGFEDDTFWWLSSDAGQLHVVATLGQGTVLRSASMYQLVHTFVAHTCLQPHVQSCFDVNTHPDVEPFMWDLTRSVDCFLMYYRRLMSPSDLLRLLSHFIRKDPRSASVAAGGTSGSAASSTEGTPNSTPSSTPRDKRASTGGGGGGGASHDSDDVSSSNSVTELSLDATQWKPIEVQAVLHSLGADQACMSRAREQCIDGPALAAMGRSALQALGLRKGQRDALRRLLRRYARLAKSYEVSSSSSSSPAPGSTGFGGALSRNSSDASPGVDDANADELPEALAKRMALYGRVVRDEFERKSVGAVALALRWLSSCMVTDFDDTLILGLKRVIEYFSHCYPVQGRVAVTTLDHLLAEETPRQPAPSLREALRLPGKLRLSDDLTAIAYRDIPVVALAQQFVYIDCDLWSRVHRSDLLQGDFLASENAISALIRRQHCIVGWSASCIRDAMRGTGDGGTACMRYMCALVYALVSENDWFSAASVFKGVRRALREEQSDHWITARSVWKLLPQGDGAKMKRVLKRHLHFLAHSEGFDQWVATTRAAERAFGRRQALLHQASVSAAIVGRPASGSNAGAADASPGNTGGGAGGGASSDSVSASPRTGGRSKAGLKTRISGSVGRRGGANVAASFASGSETEEDDATGDAPRLLWIPVVDHVLRNILLTECSGGGGQCAEGDVDVLKMEALASQWQHVETVVRACSRFTACNGAFLPADKKRTVYAYATSVIGKFHP